LDDESGISPRIAPGTQIKSGKYPVITGLEHDELGHPTGSSQLHQEMTNKRRNKLKTLANNIPSPQVYGGDEGDVLLVGWGSTQGPIREAIDRVQKAGEKWSALHIRHINPLPEGLEKAFAGFKHVMVVEMNDEGLYGYGQLAAILRARYCDSKIKGINKSDGLTYKVKEIIKRVSVAIN
jgi:2-oxoglutarate ferredoxin oxidoreductase subunit alpha